MSHKDRDVPSPVPERGDMNAHDINTIKEVLTEPSLSHHLIQVLGCGSDHSYIDLLRADSPQGGYLLFL